ncbi:hypothetical protein CHS0354_001787 [Potamilus streckersoni]|uniref:Uncharacterized protein n=1 Tax=Potamilus streckersoni TaxID=2493646 RepID=A0AAE0VP74_9BIVA|nr:hypothetical protein CHS0354_001787 [Potamilus streckersoni]
MLIILMCCSFPTMAKPIQKQELISTEVNLKSDLEVPKKNGRDCGVFVIMLAKALMLQEGG